MERFDIDARLSDVVAAAEDGAEVEIVRQGSVVARLSRVPNSHRPGPWGADDLAALKSVHEAAKPLAVRDGALLIREMRDEGF